MYSEHKQNYDNHAGHGVKEEVYIPTLILLWNDSVHTVLNPDSGKVGSPQERSPLFHLFRDNCVCNKLGSCSMDKTYL